MNTKISYLYRDAANNKQYNECIVTGEISKEQIDTIIKCCMDMEYFIPRQVEMPEKRFEKIDYQADHCWFEITKEDFELTDCPANVDLDIETLIINFQKAKDNWDDVRFGAEFVG